MILTGDELPRILVEPPGPKSKEILEIDKKCFGFGLEGRRFYPLVVEEGHGAAVRDVDGNIFLDFTASDYNLGPSHPEIVEAIRRQIEKILLFMEPAGIWENYVRFAEKLKSVAPGELKDGKVLYAISGSETNEFAIDSARFSTGRPIIIAYEAGFHGTTPGIQPFTTAFMHFRTARRISDVVHVPYPYCYRCPFHQEYPQCSLNCLEYIDWLFDTTINPEDVAAIITETIQSPGGIIIPPMDYWPKLYRKIREHGILIIDDEILVGAGRTGKMFAIENWNCVPDIITLGKSIGMGAPLSVMLARSEILERYPVSVGGQVVSFGGNPVGVTAGIKGLEILQRDKLIERSAKLGEHLLKRMQEIAEEHELIGDVRGMGLNVGVELVKDGKTKEPATEEARLVCEEAFRRGLILLRYGIWSQVLRLYPPFNITEKQLDVGIELIEESIEAVEARQ